MKINRNNYMLFFLDYYEGALSAEQQKELMQFLDDHTDLKAEFNDFEIVHLPVDKNLKFANKLSLKKALPSENLNLHSDQTKTESREQDTGPFLLHKKQAPDENFEISSQNYEEMFAAYAEGDLTNNQALAVETFAASDAFYQRELNMIKAARLEPDQGIEYHPKSALKRYFIGRTTRALKQYGSAAAAILLLAVFVFSLLPLTDSDRIAYETPVEGAGERPEAVAETPAPQQDVPETLITEAEVHSTFADEHNEIQELEKISGRQKIAELQIQNRHTTSHPQPHISSAIDIDLTAFRRQPAVRQTKPLPRMETIPAAPLVAGTQKYTAFIETREEYVWLFYMDASELLGWNYDRAGAGSREVSLGELALNRITETTDIDQSLVSEVITGSRPTLLELVNSGINRLAPEGINLLGIETVRNKDGQITYWSLGEGFSITRK